MNFTNPISEQELREYISTHELNIVDWDYISEYHKFKSQIDPRAYNALMNYEVSIDD